MVEILVVNLFSQLATACLPDNGHKIAGGRTDEAVWTALPPLVVVSRIPYLLESSERLDQTRVSDVIAIDSMSQSWLKPTLHGELRRDTIHRSLAAKSVQSRISADQHLAVGNDRSRHDAFLEVVGSQHAPVTAGLQNCDDATFANQINLTVAGNN